jgi:outer membrane protein assembly factor BamE
MPAHRTTTKLEPQFRMPLPTKTSHMLPTTFVSSSRPAALLLVLISMLMLGGCGSASSYIFPGVYRLDIPQGNIITQKQVDQLRPGLNKRQVTFILGTPLVRDTFNQNRWDYIYSFQPGGGERVQERLTVYFKDDQLLRIEGDFEQTPEKLQFPTASAKPATKNQ